jgi:hypothetical protein
VALFIAVDRFGPTRRARAVGLVETLGYSAIALASPVVGAVGVGGITALHITLLGLSVVCTLASASLLSETRGIAMLEAASPDATCQHPRGHATEVTNPRLEANSVTTSSTHLGSTLGSSGADPAANPAANAAANAAAGVFQVPISSGMAAGSDGGVGGGGSGGVASIDANGSNGGGGTDGGTDGGTRSGGNGGGGDGSIGTGRGGGEGATLPMLHGEVVWPSGRRDQHSVVRQLVLNRKSPPAKLGSAARHVASSPLPPPSHLPPVARCSDSGGFLIWHVRPGFASPIWKVWPGGFLIWQVRLAFAHVSCLDGSLMACCLVGLALNFASACNCRAAQTLDEHQLGG